MAAILGVYAFSVVIPSERSESRNLAVVVAFGHSHGETPRLGRRGDLARGDSMKGTR
jgi:hypothetical protein